MDIDNFLLKPNKSAKDYGLYFYNINPYKDDPEWYKYTDKLLKYYRFVYYTTDSPKVSDSVYDMLEHELAVFEQHHPEYADICQYSKAVTNIAGYEEFWEEYKPHSEFSYDQRVKGNLK